MVNKYCVVDDSVSKTRIMVLIVVMLDAVSQVGCSVAQLDKIGEKGV